MENLAFIDVGGEDNALDDVGKEILEKLENNEYERDTEAFIPRGTLFEDTQFPVESIPLYFTRGEVVPIQWLRPHQIVERPQFINKEPLAADVRQGSLGDCWALAAASVLAEFGPLFYRVVPPDQGFRHGYAGIFRFHFWYYGRWTEVIIDDRLPCRESNRKLLYSRPPAENVFWAILLEKAYSKLYGGYTALVGGKVRDCLSDLTGGITEEWDLQMLSDEKKADLEKILLRVSANCVFGCETENENNELQSTGLVAHHAYAITETQQFISATSQRQTIVLFIRNPWGRANWRGALSLNSPDWEMVPAGIKKYMEKKLDENSGGFWILLDDFIRLFFKIHLCFLEPHAISEVREMTDRSIRKLWDGVMFDGVWQKNATAWGSPQSAASK
ncbi:hypothetical protein niasHT_002705 [Heterodera trifolii]|uniref:Calpain catalytic domain-containing protein n=1 Tax=Heterodera trifolii TaxID=157864 RepID=A0ABD2LY13_9BILA